LDDDDDDDDIAAADQLINMLLVKSAFQVCWTSLL